MGSPTKKKIQVLYRLITFVRQHLDRKMTKVANNAKEENEKPIKQRIGNVPIGFTSKNGVFEVLFTKCQTPGSVLATRREPKQYFEIVICFISVQCPFLRINQNVNGYDLVL